MGLDQNIWKVIPHNHLCVFVVIVLGQLSGWWFKVILMYFELFLLFHYSLHVVQCSRSIGRTDLTRITDWVLLPLLCSKLILQLCDLDFYAFSSSPPAFEPIKYIPLDISSCRFVSFCCLCRPGSLRPAVESAENGHLVSQLVSVTPLTYTEVVLWIRSLRKALPARNWRGNWWESVLHQLSLCG